jgi:asparagine synthase (glutamine-hydrolysing)
MCSIIVTFNESDPSVLRSMAESIRHRGPDSFEILENGCHGIAACRLSIFGDSDGPMIYTDPVTGHVVLLNGEIYNYEDLWRDLAVKGIQRRSNFEAELIARLYELHGIDFAGHLKGMFAIAILDGQRLILARDRFGIKPLHYAKSGGSILVSSEIKGILSHPRITPVLNIMALEETRVFGYVTDPEATFFQGIRQIHPGAIVAFSDDGKVETKRFGVLPPARFLNGNGLPDYEEACTQVRDHVIKAVGGMYRHGQMEKGIYLSGGVDSSTIALVARRLLGYPVQTFTLTDSEENSDFHAARRVAQALGTRHHEYLVTVADYWRAVPDYIAHYESLMAGGVFHIQGGVAFHLLSQRIAQNVKVAFSGEGADELFGGYYWIYTHPLGFSDRIRCNLQDILPNDRMAGYVNRLFPEPEDERVYRRNLFDHLLRAGLSNYHLQSVDRSAGAFGFEIRPLYLDDDLSQYAMELPIEYKTPDKKTTKMILKDAFRKDFAAAGIGWVHERLKYGMPEAISTIDKVIEGQVASVISDDELNRHPLGPTLGSKMNLLLYDLFERIFFRGWDHRAPNPPEDSLLARVWPE